MMRAMRTILASALLLVATTASADVLEPGTGIAGRSPEQLTVLWWQWAMSVPGSSSPVNDPTGANCAAGQNGDVWFLAGGFGSSKVRRSCDVPAGKFLFFPILQKGDRSRTCDAARAGARLRMTDALELTAEIDGVPVPNPKRFRVSSQECFDVYGKVSPMLGKAEPFPSASDGYWLLVTPLAKGRHTVRFTARYGSVIANGLEQDVEYELKVN